MLALPTHAFAEDIPPPITQAQVKAGIVKVNAAAVGFRACRASSTGAQLGRCYAAVYWQLRPAVWNLMFGLDTFCDTPNSFYLRGNTLYNLLGKTHRYPTRPNVDATTRAWNAFHASLRRSLLVSRRLSGRSTAWRAAAVQMVATSRSAAAVHGRCAMPHEQRRLRLFSTTSPSHTTSLSPTASKLAFDFLARRAGRIPPEYPTGMVVIRAQSPARS